MTTSSHPPADPSVGDAPTPAEALAPPVGPADGYPEPAEVAAVELGLAPDVARAVARFDRRVEAAFDRIRGNPVADRVFYLASELGDFSLVWHLAGAVRGLTSDARANDALRLSALLGVESAVVNQGIKRLFRRERPAWEQDRAYRIRKPSTSSFPSGHASAAVFAATLLSHGARPRTKAAVWAAAAVVAASRVHVKIHHPSDVVAGAATGAALGRLAVRAWPPSNPSR